MNTVPWSATESTHPDPACTSNKPFGKDSSERMTYVPKHAPLKLIESHQPQAELTQLRMSVTVRLRRE